MSDLIADVIFESRKYKNWADKALAGLSDEAFFRRPAEHVNPIALIVKHVAGNLLSRWTDFLTTDGEKPTRERDDEFTLAPGDTRVSLMAAWEAGWQALFDTLSGLSDADLGRTVIIRGEPHRVQQALLRGIDHSAYHTGQILYLARLLNPDSPWLTVPPGASRNLPGRYLKPPA
ncbi:MAG TPA: DUF1572 family protein [Gemmataceae bacterium]|nr:DUF1572 family protein [Gemmataceae bacterium]